VNDEKMRTNIHALCEIRTHGFSVQAVKAYPQTERPLGPASIETTVFIFSIK